MTPSTEHNVLIRAFRKDRTASVPDLERMGQLLQQLKLQDSNGEGGAVVAAGQLKQLDMDQEHSIEQLTLMTRKPHYRGLIIAHHTTLQDLVRLLSAPSPSLARCAAAALQNLAIEPEHCATILAAGSLQPLLQLLRETPADSDALLAAVAGALSNLAYDDAACQDIADAPGCIPRLVALLSHDSCVVREAVASVLAKVAWEPELCAPIADAGAVKPLLTLLSTELSDDGGRQVAAAAIENLTYESPSIRTAVVESGGIPLLVSLLESDCEAAQKSAASALHNLALARPHADKIAAAGGVEPLVGLLETSSSGAVQAVAGGTLGKLAADPAVRAEMVVAREKIILDGGSDDAAAAEDQQHHGGA